MRITKTFCIILAMAFMAGVEESKAASNSGCVALTFDDGPDVNLTPKLVKILTNAHVPATFFEVGSRVVQWPEVTKMVHDAGFEIGNHSWDHPVLPSLSSGEVNKQIANTDKAILNAIGKYPVVFRAPYGSRSDRVDAIAAHPVDPITAKPLGISDRPDILWHIDTLDWEYVGNSARVVDVASGSGSGIILMHDIHAWTIDAVPALIAELKNKGYSFGTVSQYLSGTCEGGDPTLVAANTPAPSPKVATVAAKPAAKTAPASVKPAAPVVPAAIKSVAPPPVVARAFVPYKLYDDDN